MVEMVSFYPSSIPISKGPFAPSSFQMVLQWSTNLESFLMGHSLKLKVFLLKVHSFQYFGGEDV